MTFCVISFVRINFMEEFLFIECASYFWDVRIRKVYKLLWDGVSIDYGKILHFLLSFIFKLTSYLSQQS